MRTRTVSGGAVVVVLGFALASSAQPIKPLGPKVGGGVTIELVRATVTPATAAPADALRAAAAVRSSGGPSGPFSVLMKLDGREVARQAGEVGAGAERTFTFPTKAPDRTGQVCFDFDLLAERGNSATLKGDARACLQVTARLASTPGKMPGSPGSPGMETGSPKTGQKVIAPGAVLRVEGLPPAEAKARFEALPDDGLVQLKGRTLTKRQLLTEIEQKRQQAKMKASKGPSSGSDAKLGTLRSQLDAKQNADLAAKGAQAQAAYQRFAAMPADDAGTAQKELTAIHAEARQLQARFAQASPAEKVEIQARAEMLTARAKQLLGQ